MDLGARVFVYGNAHLGSVHYTNMAELPEVKEMLKEILFSTDFKDLIRNTVKTEIDTCLKKTIEDISKLESDLKREKERNDVLEKHVTTLQNDVSTLKRDLNSTEKNAKTTAIMTETGKGKNLVINGLIEDHKTAKENVQEMLAKMKINVNGEFTAQRLGAPKEQVPAPTAGWFGRTSPTPKAKPRPILIKFNNSWERKVVYGSRFGLADANLKTVFINEDLTKQNAEIFYNARAARRNNWLKSCWTEGGIVMIRRIDGNTRSVTSLEELSANYFKHPNHDDAVPSNATETIPNGPVEVSSN